MQQDISHPSAYFETGDLVKAALSGNLHRPAIICDIYDSGKLRIEWCNRDLGDALLDMKDIIFLDRPTKTTSNHEYNIDEHVEVFSETSGKYHYAKVLERCDDSKLRIKWIEHNDSKEAIKPARLIRKIRSSHPETEKYSSFQPVLALDMQTMTWRSATVLKVLRPEVFRIGWEKSTELEDYSNHSSPCLDDVFKHNTHLKPFYGERCEKEGFLYATLDKISTFGLPKQGLLNFRREYFSNAETSEFELTRPPNFLRSDPSSFFEDSMKKLKAQTEMSQVGSSESKLEPLRNKDRFIRERAVGFSSYVCSKDKEGFQELWDAFRPGDKIQVMYGGDAENIWSAEGRISKRENRRRTESIYFRIEWEDEKPKRLKIAYKLSQRSVTLRKMIEVFTEQPHSPLFPEQPLRTDDMKLQKSGKKSKQSFVSSKINEQDVPTKEFPTAIQKAGSNNENQKKKRRKDMIKNNENRGTQTIDLMFAGCTKRGKHQSLFG
jgi:hypothetical protein